MAINNGDISIFKIKKFLGLNENPDGDTVLKIGEMPTMRNFRITQDNHLQVRPGTKIRMNLYERGAYVKSYHAGEGGSITATINVSTFVQKIGLKVGEYKFIYQDQTPTHVYSGDPRWAIMHDDIYIDNVPLEGSEQKGITISSSGLTPYESYFIVSVPGMLGQRDVGGAWRGTVGGNERLVVEYNGNLYHINESTWIATNIGTCTHDTTTFFGFGNKVYMLNGHEYKSWDGDLEHSFVTVEGYIPTTQTATSPAGSGTKLENVNRLNGKRRVKFSPDGTSKVFQLPEKGLNSVLVVHINGVPYCDNYGFTYTTSFGGLLEAKNMRKLYTESKKFSTEFTCNPVGHTVYSYRRYLVKFIEDNGIVEDAQGKYTFTWTYGGEETGYFFRIAKNDGSGEYADCSYEITPDDFEAMTVGDTATIAKTEIDKTIGLTTLEGQATSDYWFMDLSKPIADLTSNINETNYGIEIKSAFSEGDTLTANLTANTNTYTIDLTNGTVTFTTAPTAGVNTIWVDYVKGSGSRSDVESMHYAEFYNGSTDTRVFLYGNGTNKAIYSGIDSNTTLASAEYFPDLYEVAVGEQNTPLTALCRHTSRLMAFKTNSAYSINYGTITLEDNTTTSAFYCTPVNRQIGNEATGQVKLLTNNPLSFDAKAIYQWKPTSNYSASISNNENNAKRVSDRVISTLKEFDFSTIETVNIKKDKEFWIIDNGVALIMNYGNDTWYKYTDIPFKYLIETDGNNIGIAKNGQIFEISRDFRNDSGVALDCYACTGAIDFNADYVLKYSSFVWVALQPETSARIYVTVESNRRSDYPEKLVSFATATFSHVDFSHFSFGTNKKPQVKRLKLKVKKATFYRLIFKSNSASSTATVIETDIKVRYAGDVKR